MHVLLIVICPFVLFHLCCLFFFDIRILITPLVSPGPPVSFTNKTDHHDIAEILLKVALNTIKQTNKRHAFYFSFTVPTFNTTVTVSTMFTLNLPLTLSRRTVGEYISAVLLNVKSYHRVEIMGKPKIEMSRESIPTHIHIYIWPLTFLSWYRNISKQWQG